MEIPAQMHPVLSAWPRGRRPRCQVCNRRLHLARQIDGTMIQFCESGCRGELGLPFSAVQPERPSVRRTGPLRQLRANTASDGDLGDAYRHKPEVSSVIGISAQRISRINRTRVHVADSTDVSHLSR